MLLPVVVAVVAVFLVVGGERCNNNYCTILVTERGQPASWPAGRPTGWPALHWHSKWSAAAAAAASLALKVVVIVEKPGS